VSKNKARLSYICAGLAAAGASYLLWIRPWLLTWGAAADERWKTLPGDQFIPEPDASATRAITIDAPPDRVWPWLAQIGQGRGGFYSYAWLENMAGCQIVNAQKVHAEWQEVKVGDQVLLHPNFPAIPVALVDPNHALVLGGKGIPEKGIPPVTWSFVIETAPRHATRLIVRWRVRTTGSVSDALMYKYMLEPIHFIMERKMMLGIKARAEGRKG